MFEKKYKEKNDSMLINYTNLMHFRKLGIIGMLWDISTGFWNSNYCRPYVVEYDANFLHLFIFL